MPSNLPQNMIGNEVECTSAQQKAGEPCHVKNKLYHSYHLCCSLRKYLLKQFPLGTILENSTLFTNWYSFYLKKIVPPRKRALFSKTIEYRVSKESLAELGPIKPFLCKTNKDHKGYSILDLKGAGMET